MSDFTARLLRLEADTARAATRLSADEIREAALENASWLTARPLGGAPVTAATSWTCQVSYGVAVAGATVEVFDPGGTLVASGTTNASGFVTLSITVPASYLMVPYALHVTYPGANPSPYIQYEPLWGSSVSSSVFLY